MSDRRAGPAPSDKSASSVTSLVRGLRLLEQFCESEGPLGTADLAKRTGLPQPTVWRLCHTLKQTGYLKRANSTDKLELAYPVLSLGYAALSDLGVAELALPYMQNLADRYGGGISLGTREGHDIVYLQRCQGTSIIFSDFRVGSHVSMLRSATGWGYLAGLARDRRKALLGELHQADPATFAAVEPSMRDAVADYERTGFISSVGVMHSELNAVSVPIRSVDGERVLSLTCGGIASVFTPDVLADVGPQLGRLAGDLSLAL